MSNLKRNIFMDRSLFTEDFIQLDVRLTVLENHFLFIGSIWDELEQVPSNIFDESLSFEEKLNTIGDYIKPMSSTILINDKPTIPGSTIKGAIRFRTEHSFKPDKNSNYYSCFIKQQRPSQKKYITNFLKFYNYWPDVPNQRPKENTRPSRDLKDNPKKFCRVCDLFGNSAVASRVIFSDGISYDAKLESVELKVRNGTDYKRVISPKSIFSFSVNINNVSKEDLALLYLGMNLKNDGIQYLGMNKFSTQKDTNRNLVHFGKIKFEIAKVKQYFYEDGKIDVAILESPEEIIAFNNVVFERIEEFGNILREF